MGLDLGLHQVGIQVTLAVEIDPRCCETIRRNRSDLDLIQGDVRKLSGALLREHRGYQDDVLLMVGGPPCQSFSPGGKRAGLSDPRGNLIYEYFRLIGEVRPQFFIFENVANLITTALRHRRIEHRPGKHWNLKQYENEGFNTTDGSAAPLEPDELSGSAFRQLLTDIADLGYAVSFGVLDAADYGVAQHRLRLCLLGARDGVAPHMPAPTHGPCGSASVRFVTLRDVIADLRCDPGPHSVYTPPMAAFFAYVPEGGTWRNLPQELQEVALGKAYHSGGGKTGFFRRLRWDAPAPTITGRANRKGSALCHPEHIRPLSVRECARVQGFPDSWVFAGGMNQQYLQIGNAVPVGLGHAIGKSVLDRLHAGDHHSQTGDVEGMLDASVARLRASARNRQQSQIVQTSYLENL